ncbi:MAG: hypothetical protein MJ252_10460 [archaeon]|nr:hypothetical protein [archaeon]
MFYEAGEKIINPTGDPNLKHKEIVLPPKRTNTIVITKKNEEKVNKEFEEIKVNRKKKCC